MKTYHKINTIYKRDDYGNLKLGDWSVPEFGMLQNIGWIGTEKIDGTNIRIIFDGETVEVRGKTDRAQLRPRLVSVILEKYTPEMFKKIFDGETNVCIYGEGYGFKIQKGSNYIANDNDLIAFDIKVNGLWLRRESCEEIINTFDGKMVPIIGTFTIQEAIDYVKKGFKSTIAQNKDYYAEGLVLKPKYELFDRRGNRIITKIKHRDFHD